MEFIKKYKNLISLILIVLIAAGLRLYQLNSNPPSLTWDEAAWGYNAYSLGVDGKDEFSRFMPYDYLESFGDFKPPLYAYLDVIPIKILGLNEFAVRLPSALFGILTVIVTYFLVKQIFFKSKNATMYALVSSLLLAVSPWHIMLSRAAFEANVASFFLVSGIWGFLASIQGKKWYLIISAISFVLSIYTFNTSRVFVPIIVLILVFAFRKKLFEIKKQVIVAGIVGLLLALPIAGFLFSPQAALRFREVNIFTDSGPVKISNRNIENGGGGLVSNILNNRRVFYGISFTNHYFDNLSPMFLFVKGDGNPKFSIRSIGQMYIWESIFFISGLLLLFRKREGNWWLIPVWLLVGILPAATARETPHALRIEATLPTFQILTAYGIIWIWDVISNVKYKILNMKLKYIMLWGFLLVAIFNFVYFVHTYFVHYAYEYSGEWQFGYKESINFVKSVEDNYDEIQITNALGRPYIYYLFYLKTDPESFRKNAKVARDTFGFVKVNSFGKYNFPEKYEHSLNSGKKTLYINTPYNLPEGIKILKTFRLLNGQPVLVAYEL